MSRRFFATDWGTPVSTASRGGVVNAMLENSGWVFRDATFRGVVDVSTIEGRAEKVIRCTTAGLLALSKEIMGQTAAQAGRGSFDFAVYKGGAANAINVALTANQATHRTDGAFDGHVLNFMADESILFARYDDGAIAQLFTTAASYFAISTWYRLHVDVTALGAWTISIKGGTFAAWTVVGTAADNTYPTSNFIVLDLDAGDMVSLGDVTGNGGVVHTSLPY